LTAPEGAPPARLLAWDTDFWQVPVAQFLDPASPAELERADAWCREHGARVAFLALDAGRTGLVEHAARLGFEVIETGVTASRPLGRGLARSTLVRPAGTGDVDAAAAIARRDLRGVTRFYRDPSFPDPRCDDLYAEWVRASVAGWADASFVIDADDAPAGFVTAHRAADGRPARVGLLVVAPGTPWQRVSRARQLLETAFAHLGDADEPEVTLTTQAHNRATIRLLELVGCTQGATSLHLHRWYGGPPPASGPARTGAGGGSDR
jgi:ribosomal protein S18 acetylase RimI-like enzyme